MQLAVGQFRSSDFQPIVSMCAWGFPFLFSWVLMTIHLEFFYPIASLYPNLENKTTRVLVTGFVTPVVLFAVRFVGIILEYNNNRLTELSWLKEVWAASFWDVLARNSESTGTEEEQQFTQTIATGEVFADDIPTSDATIGRKTFSPHPHSSDATTTLADTALRKARPVWVVKGLIQHMVLLIISTISCVALTRLSGAPEPQRCWRPENWDGAPPPYWIYACIHIYANKTFLAIALHVTSSLVMDMFGLAVFDILHLLRWQKALKDCHTHSSNIDEDGIISKADDSLTIASCVSRLMYLTIWALMLFGFIFSFTTFMYAGSSVPGGGVYVVILVFTLILLTILAYYRFRRHLHGIRVRLQRLFGRREGQLRI